LRWETKLACCSETENQMADHLEFGKKGEEIAADHLRNKGYKILDTNWRFGRNEIDLVAKDPTGRYLVVAEVKSRHSVYGGEPETAVTREKQKSLIRAADAYLRVKNLQDEIRFDIISIVCSKEGEKVKHIEDAFYPTL
jgi:putative endonuclease